MLPAAPADRTGRPRRYRLSEPLGRGPEAPVDKR